MQPILTVSDVFEIPAWGGLVVVPGPLMADGPARPEGPVILRRPDGSIAGAVLRMDRILQSPPSTGEPRWTCLLMNLEKADVPLGTEIWPDT